MALLTRLIAHWKYRRQTKRATVWEHKRLAWSGFAFKKG